MSLSHHSDNSQGELIKRFVEQTMGLNKRTWSDGRIGAEDDGDLSYAMATDDARRIIIIKFPKPIDWIGLDVKSAEELRDQLTYRLLALRGITK